MVAKYAREVIDRVRVDEEDRLRANRRVRELVEGARWLLLKNREHVVRAKDRVRLTDLLNGNRALLKV